MLELFSSSWGAYAYTLAATGTKFRTKTFSSRQAAQNYMYEYCGKHHHIIDHVYDDKHFKTYICSDGVRFYINRM